jgi:F-type H+-transporting ATPase subunit c
MDPNFAKALAYLAAGLGAGLTAVGAGNGIGKLASSAMEAMGRQPEASSKIQLAMIIAAAFIEGLGFFIAIICLLLAIK